MMIDLDAVSVLTTILILAIIVGIVAAIGLIVECVRGLGGQDDGDS